MSIKYRDQSRHGFSIKGKKKSSNNYKGNMQHDTMQPINEENKIRINQSYLS